jgi:flagellar hook protein FlgE
MLGSLSTAVSGLEAYQQDMEVIGNNIANSNTTGFKDATVDLGNTFSNTLLAASSGSGTNTMQVGTGVAIDAINNNWSEGTLTSTNNSSDLAISGNGFFTVRDPNAAAGTNYLTQDGALSVDPTGYLVDANGFRIQAYSTGATPTLGDVQLPASQNNGQFSVSSTGVISYYNTQTNAETTLGQLALTSVQNPNALVSVAGNLYTNQSNAGATTGTAGTAQTALADTTIQQGYLEMSNVDLSNEMANLITAQRGFEANSKIITSSDELLQTVINMIH